MPMAIGMLRKAMYTQWRAAMGLVKLTEVCQNTYMVPTVEDYTLREVFVNPEHVVKRTGQIARESRYKPPIY